MAGGVEYRVSTIYETVDRASKNLKEIGVAAQNAAKATMGLTEALKTLAVGAGLYKAFDMGKHAAFGLNQELENSKSQLAGIMRLTTNANWDQSIDRAAKSMERFKEFSWQTGTGIGEIAKTASIIEAPLIAAGMKIKDIENLAHEATRVGEAFGSSAEATATSIARAVMTGTTRDMMMRGFLLQQNITMEKFEKMSGKERGAAIYKAFTSKGAAEAADYASDKTFSGGLGDLKSHLEKLLATAGEPLFKAVTDELQRMKTWLQDNRQELEGIANTVGEKLVNAFSAIKEIGVTVYPLLKEVGSVMMSVMSFASEHKDAIIGLAKALIVLKVGEKLGGLAKSGFGAVGNLFGGTASGIGGGVGLVMEGFKGLKNGTGSITDAFGNLSKILSGVAGPLGSLLKVLPLAKFGFDLLTKETETEKKAREQAQGTAVKAGEFTSLVNERDKIKNYLRSVGYNPDDPNQVYDQSSQAEIDRLKQLEANYSATAQALLAEGEKTGYVSKMIKDGVVEYRRHNVMLDRNIKDVNTAIGTYSEISGALNTLFQERIKDLRAQYGGLPGASGPDEALLPGGTWWGGQNAGQGGGVMGVYAYRPISQKTAKEPQSIMPEINQTVNITIQRVMAKDPNRWLADMDDMVKEKTRAGTRAKNAWRPSPR